MQNNIAKAFRQRLARASYTEISIYRVYSFGREFYRVRCRSPRGEWIDKLLSLTEMDCRPRSVLPG